MNSRMKGKPNFDEFRSGGGAEPHSAPPPSPPAIPTAAETAQALAARQAALDSAARESKTIRMRKSFSVKVRAQAFNRSNAEGRKVTESDIIDEALEQYFSTLQQTT